jgi:hypothetical protein
LVRCTGGLKSRLSLLLCSTNNLLLCSYGLTRCLNLSSTELPRLCNLLTTKCSSPSDICVRFC